MKAGSRPSLPSLPTPCPLEPRTEPHLQYLSDALWLSPCQGRYFLVRDVTEQMDVLGTSGSCGAPNFRQARGGLPVFGMGQPSLLGFRRVLRKLQEEGHKVSTRLAPSALLPRLAPQVWERGSQYRPTACWGEHVVPWTGPCQGLTARVVIVAR